MPIVKIKNRAIIEVVGKDSKAFLQSLITQDINLLLSKESAYACLLTPQGKFLYDFILTKKGNSIFLECEKARIADLVKLLNMYALRAELKIVNLSNKYNIYACWGGDRLEGAYQDPRLNELGFRLICDNDKKVKTTAIFEDYDYHRTLLGVPDGSRDMKPKFSNLLECNIDKFNGISWDKGCYIGQELTARMRYRGKIKKQMVTVRGNNLPKFGENITNKQKTVIGEMRSSVLDIGLAIFKKEFIKDMQNKNEENIIDLSRC